MRRPVRIGRPALRGDALRGDTLRGDTLRGDMLRAVPGPGLVDEGGTTRQPL